MYNLIIIINNSWNKGFINVYLLAADRTGITIKGVYLLGCSCIVKLGSKCDIVKYLDKHTNGIIVQEIEF